MSYNLAQPFFNHCRSTPDAVAVASDGLILSYKECAGLAAGLANRLQADGALRRSADGMPPRVGILASRSANACVAVLGACWAGATYVPLGLNLPEDRLVTILSLCDLSAIVTDEQGYAQLNDRVLRAAPPLIYALGAAPDRHAANRRVAWLSTDILLDTVPDEPAHVEPHDIAYVIFTSGTTGTPKGVMIAAESARHHFAQLTTMLELRASDRILETFELTFDPSGQNMFTAWEAGASLHILPPSRVMNAVKFARDNNITVWNSVPSLVGMLHQVKALTPGVLPMMRVTLFGGEQLPQGVVNAWRIAAPAGVIYNLYGPTEVTIACLGQLVTEPVPLTPGRDVVAIGSPLEGNEVAVLDEHGEPVEDGSPGELAIAGVQLAVGYLTAPELTHARFPVYRGRRWYLTGDLAIRDSAGIFHCLGRIDNQVKVLGHRVELEEVDAHLRAVTKVDVVGTVAWPLIGTRGSEAAQGLVAFIGTHAIDLGRISTALKERLPYYMVPHRIHALEQMPLNANGKVDRKALQQLLATWRA